MFYSYAVMGKLYFKVRASTAVKWDIFKHFKHFKWDVKKTQETLHQNLFASILANRVAVYKGRVLTPAEATQYWVAPQVSWTPSVNGKNI